MSETGPTNPSTAPGGGGITVSHLLGEMTWLLTQSPFHRALAVGDLEWLLMPPLILRQFYIFREGEKPIGLALWARCDPSAAAKLEKGLLESENQLSLTEWNSGDAVWLVDLIAPFADGMNRHREIMIADLISGPLAGQRFNFHQTSPETGERTVQVIEADAGERLKKSIADAMQSG